MAGSGRKVWAADEVLAADDLQKYIQDQVVFVYNDASARTSGILAPTEGMMSYLKDTNLIYAYDGSSWVEIAPNVGTAGTYTKVTTDAKGRVSSGTTLSNTDIPALDSSKITTGGFDASRITTGGFDASRITSGTFPDARLAGISASKISGTISNEVNTTSNIATTGNINCNGTLAAGSITSPGNVNADSGIKSTGAYNTSVAYGSYRAAWINSDGTFGHTASSRTVKQDIEPTDLMAGNILDVEVVNFRYIDAVENIGDKAAVETGVIAEQLIDVGLGRFVFFNEDGSPAGVHYDRLVVALIPQLQEQATQLALLNERISKLEK